MLFRKGYTVLIQRSMAEATQSCVCDIFHPLSPFLMWDVPFIILSPYGPHAESCPPLYDIQKNQTISYPHDSAGIPTTDVSAGRQLNIWSLY